MSYQSESPLSSASLLSSTTLSTPSTSPFKTLTDLGLSPIRSGSSARNAAVSAEGVISINQRVSFAGDRLDVRDDALLYAGKGVNVNQTPEFSLINDLGGNPIRDLMGRLQVRDQALVLGNGYSTFNIPNNPYGGINPAQTVAPRTVDVPVFSDLKTLVLNQKTPIAGTFTSYSAQTPLNSLADWQASFPNGMNSAKPTLIRVVNGGLNIPNGVTLDNAIVIVENGDINFNGNGHRLKNVVLVAENGSVNLSNIQTQDVTVLASRSIQMNSAARFGGKTLLANGDTNGITFNGATTSNTDADALTVVSQGRLTFNASSDTRGAFFSRGDFSFNSAVELVGVIQTKGDLFFNAAGSVKGFTEVAPKNPDPIVIPKDPTPIVIPNRPPTITTTAITTATAGQRYTYDVNAIDPDNNSLAYSLLNSPQGMTIDQASGLITWNPTTQPTGNYAVSVNVSDGLGGIANQAFSIGLTNTPVKAPTGEMNGLDGKPDENVPNIRPRFISNPVLEAIVRQAYRYDSDAIDADGEALTYSLTSGPEGLTIDVRTGVISWSPATQAAGSYQTTIQVVDGRGGRDEQTFTLNLSNLSIKDDPGLLYLQDFEKPTGFSNDGGDVNIYKGVNQLYGEQPAGFSFAQDYTVETLLVGGNQAHRGDGFRDPQGVAGRYVLGMLSDMQNDLLGLSFNIGSFKFLNFQLDISPIVPDLWRGNSVDTGGLPPTFRISLYDNPTGKTALGSGKALDFIDIVGLTSPSRSLFNWSNHTIALDTSGNTNGNVILQLDLLTGGYAAMDNFRVVASDLNFGLVKAA